MPRSPRRKSLASRERSLGHRKVLVKVSGGAKSLRGALAHVRYIDRHGQLDIETDQGDRLKGEDSGNQLLADWELDAAVAVLYS